MPFLRSPVCSCLVSVLVNIWFYCIFAAGRLRECWPRASHWLCPEHFADGSPAIWLMQDQVPLGRDSSFNSASPSALVRFLNSGPWGRNSEPWGRKKKRERCQTCILYVGAPCLCFAPVGNVGGAGSQSGLNDSSVTAWGYHLESDSCSGSLLAWYLQLFLKHACFWKCLSKLLTSVLFKNKLCLIGFCYWQSWMSPIWIVMDYKTGLIPSL